MAQRIKTTEWGFPLAAASVASTVARTFTAITVYAPETTSRTIRSAHLEFFLQDNSTAAANTTALNMSVQIDAIGASAATVTHTFAQSGENYTMLATKDVTSYFVTNFTGASHSVTAAITVTGAATINACCKLVLTYEYDDAAQDTRIKTVRIPIDGNNGNLTTAYVNLGSLASQIPNLDTFLPEASKVYRNIFMQWDTHDGHTAAGASTLDISYDGGTTTVSNVAQTQTDLNSDVYVRRIDNLTATLNTAASANLQAKCTTVTATPYPCLNGVLYVTYEYDHSTSTRVMNSIIIGAADDPGWAGGTTTGDKSRFTRTVSIQEPGTITLEQSAVQIWMADAGAITMDLRVGSQASRVYTQPTSAHCGGMSVMRRIDSGATGGAGITLARGMDNTLTVDWFSTSATANNIGSNITGICYLNYTSDIHADGDGVHNHTTKWCIQPHATGNLVQRLQRVPTITPNIPEAEYWLSGLVYETIFGLFNSTPLNVGLSVLCEEQAGEGEGAGWVNLYMGFLTSDAESGTFLIYGRARDDFKRWPADSDTGRINIETARDYRFDCSATGMAMWQLIGFVTHHAITYQIAGTVTGSAGGTVTIDAHRESDGMMLGAASRTGNGAYSITWYDNVGTVYAEAYEDGTHIGRSANGTAV